LKNGEKNMRPEEINTYPDGTKIKWFYGNQFKLRRAELIERVGDSVKLRYWDENGKERKAVTKPDRVEVVAPPENLEWVRQ
jgi:hypothetical protein